MKPWNRLRSLAGRLLASDDGRVQNDDAIFLTRTARRNHQGQAGNAPQIRERHFGIGLRREKSADSSRADNVQPGLLARLGFSRDRRATGIEQNYFGTRITGAAHPAPRPETPARASLVPLPAAAVENEPSSQEIAVLDSLFGKEPRATPTAPMQQAAPEATKPVELARDPEPTPPAPKKSATGKKQSVAAKTATVAPKPAQSPAPVASAKAKPARKKRGKMDRDDLTIASLGVVLGVTCALFPWYIFFNQEKFGVREFTFSGGGTASSTTGIPYMPQPVGKPFASAELPKMELDFFPTATLPSPQEPPRAVPASEQPFPADRVNFRLVHVANGRAMIEDGDGLWVVQRGSQLPDASRVAAIEQRNGHWVLVTTTDKIVELTR